MITGVSATIRDSPAASMEPGFTGITNWRNATVRTSGTSALSVSQTTATVSLRKAMRGRRDSEASDSGVSRSDT